MHEHSGGYTVSAAMELARALKYGPLRTYKAMRKARPVKRHGGLLVLMGGDEGEIMFRDSGPW